MEQTINRHHLWWERNWYQQKNDKRLRQLGGFVIPATIYSHQLLHSQMHPPVKPFARLRDDIVDYAVSLNKTNRFNVPLQTADWLEQQSETHHSDEYATRALRLAHHLRQQIGYLTIQEIHGRQAA